MYIFVFVCIYKQKLWKDIQGTNNNSILIKIILIKINKSLVRLLKNKEEKRNNKQCWKLKKKGGGGGLPGGSLVETLPSNAGDVGSTPGWGTKIPHAVQPKKYTN